MRYLFLLLVVCFFVACEQDSSEGVVNIPKDAQSIVDRAIKVHGNAQLQGNTLRFTFRERNYRAYLDDGKFIYARSFEDTLGNQYTDILSNQRFYRKVNGGEIELSSKDSSAYANALNSVIYFALLPNFLNDQAAKKVYLGKGTVKGQEYHKVKVTFSEDGGGKDFEDEYVYWFHAKDYSMDYLAYNYQVNGGGARFREAYNLRSVAGLRMADYNNYKPFDKRMDVENFDQLFDQDSLKLLSKIELEDVELVKDID
jgi:hypothetical protein